MVQTAERIFQHKPSRCALCSLFEALELLCAQLADRWPVDVSTDLLTVLEQWPEALVAIGSGVPFAIDFYEQGVERKISFSPAGAHYVAECLCYGEWEPNPSVERVERATLLREMTAVLDEFMRFMRGSAPELAQHPWVRSWLEGKCHFMF